MKGQSIIEYILILGLVIMALYAMGPYFKRGVQTVIKGTADQLAHQQKADQDFSPDTSHLAMSFTSTNIENQDVVYNDHGLVNTTYSDTTTTYSEVVTNMGFSQ